jgi:hypothetical protein
VIFKEYGIYDQNSINQLFNVLRSVLSAEKTCPAGSRERLLRWNSKPGDSISGVLTKMIKSMAGRVPPAFVTHISSFFDAQGFDKGQADCCYASIYLHSAFEGYETCLMRPRSK